MLKFYKSKLNVVIYPPRQEVYKQAGLHGYMALSSIQLDKKTAKLYHIIFTS